MSLMDDWENVILPHRPIALHTEPKESNIYDIIKTTCKNSEEELNLKQKLVLKQKQLKNKMFDLLAGGAEMHDMRVHGKITGIKQLGATIKLEYIIPGSNDVRDIPIGAESVVKYHEGQTLGIRIYGLR